VQTHHPATVYTVVLDFDLIFTEYNPYIYTTKTNNNNTSASKSGCSYHGYADGYNLGVKKLKSGLPEDHRIEYELQLEARIWKQRDRWAGKLQELPKRAAEEARSTKTNCRRHGN
jgi:hypothetical protein